MPSPRTRRLLLNEQMLQGLLRDRTLIQIAGKAGIPPEIYRITYNIRGLYLSRSREILEPDCHLLEVNLMLGYPGLMAITPFVGLNTILRRVSITLRACLWVVVLHYLVVFHRVSQNHEGGLRQ